MTATQSGQVPPGAQLPVWLVKVAGEDAPDVIADGFARMSSFCCRTGYERCEACDGTGYTSTTCLACVGVGRVRCACCGGTALFPYEDVPDTLLPGVINTRISLICLIFQRIALPDAADPTDAGPRIVGIMRMLQNIEKLLGVLDNSKQALVAHRSTADSQLAHLRIKNVASKLRAAELEPVLWSLATAWATRPPSDNHSASEVADRAAFYFSLVDAQSLRGTGLARPTLFAEDRGDASASFSPAEGNRSRQHS